MARRLRDSNGGRAKRQRPSPPPPSAEARRDSHGEARSRAHSGRRLSSLPGSKPEPRRSRAPGEPDPGRREARSARRAPADPCRRAPEDRDRERARSAMPVESFAMGADTHRPDERATRRTQKTTTAAGIERASQNGAPISEARFSAIHPWLRNQEDIEIAGHRTIPRWEKVDVSSRWLASEYPVATRNSPRDSGVRNAWVSGKATRKRAGRRYRLPSEAPPSHLGYPDSSTKNPSELKNRKRPIRALLARTPPPEETDDGPEEKRREDEHSPRRVEQESQGDSRAGMPKPEQALARQGRVGGLSRGREDPWRAETGVVVEEKQRERHHGGHGEGDRSGRER